MKKEYHILINFGLYIITFITIIIIGITGVFADTYYTNYNDTQTYFDNSGSSVSLVNSSWNESLQAYVSNSLPTMANSYGGLVVFNSPISIIKNHTYSLSIFFYQRQNIAISSKPRIALGTYVGGARDNYTSSNYYATDLVHRVVNSSILQYTFTANMNASYIALPWTTGTTTSQTYVMNEIVIEDLGSEGISESTINNSLNNQTNILNNSITASTNTITENSNNNRQAIIDNQNANNEALIENDNANTDKIIEENKKNLNDCHDSVNLLNISAGSQTMNGITYTINEDKSITLNGTASALSYIQLSTVFSLNGTYTLSGGNNLSNNIYLRGLNIDHSYQIDFNTINYPTNTVNSRYAFYLYVLSGTTVNNITVYPQIQKGTSATDYEEYGKEICVNKLDEANKTSKGILGKLGDLLDYFNPFSENWFVKKLVDLLIDGLKALFVPSQNELSSLIDSFKSTMETKLGAIYQVADLLVSVVQSVLSPASSNSCMTFPEIKDPMFNKILINQTEYCFDSLRQDFAFLFTLSDMIISIVCTLAFGNMLYKKYEGFIGGNSSDY